MEIFVAHIEESITKKISASKRIAAVNETNLFPTFSPNGVYENIIVQSFSSSLHRISNDSTEVSR